MIIDAHVHVTEEGYFLYENETISANLDLLKAEIERNQIDKAIILPIGGMLSICRPQTISNRYVCNIVQSNPGHFIGFASVTEFTKANLSILKNEIKEYGLKGLKLHPILQDFFPSDKKIFPYYEYCSDSLLPVVFHTGVISGQVDLRKADPLLVKPVAKKFPDLKIILAHSGRGSKSPSHFLSALNLAKEFKNIYLGLSYTPTKMVKKIIKEIGYNRCFFESDFPFGNIKEVVESIKSAFENEDKQISDSLFNKNIMKLVA